METQPTLNQFSNFVDFYQKVLKEFHGSIHKWLTISNNLLAHTNTASNSNKNQLFIETPRILFFKNKIWFPTHKTLSKCPFSCHIDSQKAFAAPPSPLLSRTLPAASRVSQQGVSGGAFLENTDIFRQQNCFMWNFDKLVQPSTYLNM